MTCIKSLDGADENTLMATKAAMAELIFKRMDWNCLQDDNQIQNFKCFVSHAVAVVCDATPEHIIPVRVLSVNGVPVSGSNFGNTIH